MNLIGTLPANFNGFDKIYNFRLANSPRSRDRYDFTNEPTFLAFSIRFDFDDSIDPETNLPNSPLFNMDENCGGAYSYLLSRNRFMEAELLKKFRLKLMNISEEQPWFFQSINGLNEIWKRNTDMSNPLKGKDLKIKIDTLESLDLSMAYIADLYRMFTYDHKFMREILPDNLRWFSCDVYVCEFRNIRVNSTHLKTGRPDSVRDYMTKKNADGNIENITGSYDLIGNHEMSEKQYNWLEKAKTFHRYRLNMCEFDFSETVPYTDLGVDKIPEAAKNSFSILPNWNVELNSYDLQTAFNDETLFKDNDQSNNTNNKINPTVSETSKGTLLSPIGDIFKLTTAIMDGSLVDNAKQNLKFRGERLVKNMSHAIGFDYASQEFMKMGREIQKQMYGNQLEAGVQKSDLIYNSDGTDENQENAVKEPIVTEHITQDQSNETDENKSANVALHDVSKFDKKTKVGVPTLHEPLSNEHEDKDSNVTIHDVISREFNDESPNVTIHDIIKPEFEDVEPNVTVSDITEQEFEDVEPNVAISDVNELEFEDIAPNVTVSDVTEQEFEDVEPNIALSDVVEQEFSDITPNITVSDVVEQEFIRRKPNMAMKQSPVQRSFKERGKPTRPNEHNVSAGNTEKQASRTKANDPIELEFSTSTGSPTKSLFDKIVEEQNQLLKGNVTHSEK